MKHGLPVWNRVALATLSGSALMVSTAVHAQAPSAQTTELKEVVVTATRRSEDIQDLSASATVLSGELLADKGVLDLAALQYAAPGITVTQYGSANVFNIRGLGRSQVDIDVPSGVVIYRDGAPTVAGYFQNEPYFDMESIEVYRGPQGTLVGKSAAGGAVFINTNDPELGDSYGSAEASIGSYDAIEATLMYNAPLSDTVALRMGYSHYERDHFYDSITGDYTGNPGEVNNHSFRVGFLMEPTDNFKAVLKLDYHDLDFGGNVTTVYGEKPLGDVEQNAQFAYTDKSFRTVLDLKYQFANGVTLSSLTGYQDIESVNNLDVNATLPAIYYFNSKIEAQVYSQEFNLISADDSGFDWVLGAFYQEQDSVLPDWEEGGFNFIGNGFPLPYPWATSPWDNTESDISVFAHVVMPLADRVDLELGARYTEYERDQFTHWVLSFAGEPPVEGNPGVIPWATSGGDRHSIDEDSFDWQVALNFDVRPDQHVYGLISRGHVTGGINIFPPFVSYDEMEVINYEMGWKGSWANDDFRTQFTIFYQEFSDYQANFADSFGGLNFPTNRNAETDSHQSGVELSGQARVGNLSIDFGVAYLDSELGTFSDVVDPFRTPPDNIVNLSGARAPFSPEFTGNIGFAYEIPLGDFTLTPRIDYAHVDATQGALWDTDLVTLDSRDLVNMQIQLLPTSGKWSATLWGTNVGDREYIAGIQNNATLYYAGAPAQYGLRVKYNF
ncbi:MAG: TonB-dependent receptor [Pseudomonadota bacterium]|nr:TonB-dependent receptor [Pseudomonadota bacterium]